MNSKIHNIPAKKQFNLSFSLGKLSFAAGRVFTFSKKFDIGDKSSY